MTYEPKPILFADVTECIFHHFTKQREMQAYSYKASLPIVASTFQSWNMTHDLSIVVCHNV